MPFRHLTRGSVRRCSPYGFIPASALLLLALGCGETDSPTGPAVSTTPQATPQFAATATAGFHQVTAGYDHSCGITSDARTYCWGSARLGDGSDATNRVPPRLVAGEHRFRQVSAGYSSTCGIDPENRAWCWGQFPALVDGGRRFKQIDVGTDHVCAVGYDDKKVYCWGSNRTGKLGDGTLTSHQTPAAVAGTRQFRQVSAGWDHTCALATSGAVFCWGDDSRGQMGDGSEVTHRLTPHRISSSLLFRQLDAGAYHTCAVTTDNRTFCWGEGRNGQIGDGRLLRRFTPSAVKGGLAFDRVTAGYSHTCGESTGNRAYCWGNNVYGALGDGTTNGRSTPGPVAGGLFFTQLSANGFHTCGVASDDTAYCWGYNWSAQLGDGTIENRSTPTRVTGVM